MNQALIFSVRQQNVDWSLLVLGDVRAGRKQPFRVGRKSPILAGRKSPISTGQEIALCHETVKAPATPRLWRPWQPCAPVLWSNQEGPRPLLTGLCRSLFWSFHKVAWIKLAIFVWPILVNFARLKMVDFARPQQFFMFRCAAKKYNLIANNVFLLWICLCPR